MIIVGDSHVRSYTKSQFLSSAIFVGSGKENNFSSNAGLISYMLRIGILKFSSVPFIRKSSIVIVIGEPDVRYSAYRSWYPKNVSLDTTQSFELLDLAVKRFKIFLAFTSLIRLNIKYVIGSGTPNEDLNQLAQYFNANIGATVEASELRFFNPQAIFEKSKYKASYRGLNVFNPEEVDNVHLGHKISENFDTFVRNTCTYINVVEKNTSNFSSLLIDIIYYENFISHRVKYYLGLRWIFHALQRK